MINIFLSLNTNAAPPIDSSAYELVQKIEIEAQLITSDKLQQLYVVTSQNELIKYNAQGQELFRYSNNTLGSLDHVDVTNPFNVLLYYPEFLTVVTLNRTMNQTGAFDLYDLNFVEVQSVALSNDNNVWLYDDVFFRIKKINHDGQVLRESENLSNQFEKVLQPNYLLERDNWLYVNDPNLGILVFDNFGQYTKTIDLLDLSSFQVIDNQLIFREKATLQSFHLQSLSTKMIELPEGIAAEDQISVQRNHLFVQKAKEVLIYKF